MFKKKHEYALIPLEAALLFPGMILPMHIYEEDYIRMIEHAMATTKKIAITQRKPGFETDPLAGTMCCIGNVTYAEDAVLEDVEGKAVVVSGVERASLLECTQKEPFIIARFKMEPDKCSSQTVFNRCKQELPKLLMRYLFLKNLPERDIHLANLIVDPGHVADFVAFYFIEDIYAKMAFLENTDVCSRCTKARDFLSSELNRLSKPEKGENDV